MIIADNIIYYIIFWFIFIVLGWFCITHYVQKKIRSPMLIISAIIFIGYVILNIFFVLDNWYKKEVKKEILEKYKQETPLSLPKT